MGGQVVRAMPRNAAPITIEVDGEPVEAWTGESVLVAVLAYRGALRRLEFGNEGRISHVTAPATHRVTIDGAMSIRLLKPRS